MITFDAKIAAKENIAAGVWLLTFFAPAIAAAAKPGQFINVKVGASGYPLLRRPFSICSVDDPYVTIMFTVAGEGTRLLAAARTGDSLNILGPLGNGFSLHGEYRTAVLVGGGIGVAPFPFVISRLAGNRQLITVVGARTASAVVSWGMQEVRVATDDGSRGFHGNAVELFSSILPTLSGGVRVFGCGPNPMLRALAALCAANAIHCQISVESAMACGFGICQGCPIEKSDNSGYALICKDGPVFNSAEVVL